MSRQVEVGWEDKSYGVSPGGETCDSGGTRQAPPTLERQRLQP